MTGTKKKLQAMLEAMQAEKGQLSTMLKDAQIKADARIDALIKASPVYVQVQGVRDEFQRYKDTLQRKNDHLGGKIEALTALYEQCFVDVPDALFVMPAASPVATPVSMAPVAQAPIEKQPAPPPEPPNPQPRARAEADPLSTKALLAQQAKEKLAKKETAPEKPEPSKKRNR
jgi:hypothetical protein